MCKWSKSNLRWKSTRGRCTVIKFSYIYYLLCIRKRYGICWVLCFGCWKVCMLANTSWVYSVYNPNENEWPELIKLQWLIKFRMPRIRRRFIFSGRSPKMFKLTFLFIDFQTPRAGWTRVANRVRLSLTGWKRTSLITQHRFLVWRRAKLTRTHFVSF